MPTQIDKDEITKLNKIKPDKKNYLQTIFNRLLSAFIVIILVLLSYFLFLIISTSGQVFTSSEDESCSNWFCNVQSGFTKIPSIFGGDVRLKGQSSDRTNILLLGVDATTGTGLSDTIMIASIYHSDKKIVTVNIPRDTLVQYKESKFKINELYGAAEINKIGSGPTELSNFLAKEFGIDMHYWVMTNFAGTKKAIDLIGGVDINVEADFTDCEYPNSKYGYLPCQEFEKGSQAMDGDRALVYARSRHGNNGEGSDFARSKRQSIVVQSLLQKVKSQNVFQNITKFTEVISLLGNNVKTNMTPAELKSLANFGKDIDLKSSFLRTSWAVGNGFLCDTTDPELGYYIYYCADKINNEDETDSYQVQIMGNKSYIPSKAKTKAINSVKNLLAEAQNNLIADTEIIVLGNGAKSAQKIYTLLSDSTSPPTFRNVSVNNFNNKIPVTTTPEKITVYILDPALNQAIKNKIDNSTKPLIYTISNSLDAKVKLPISNTNAKVIVYLE